MRLARTALAVACLSMLPGCGDRRGLNSLSAAGHRRRRARARTSIQAQLPDVVDHPAEHPGPRGGRQRRQRHQDRGAGLARPGDDAHQRRRASAREQHRHGRDDEPAGVGMHIELAPPADAPPEGELEERLGDPAVGGRHLPDHRADAGVGVDAAQRRRAGAACRRSTRRSPRRWRGRESRSAQPARRSWTSSSRSSISQTDDIISATESLNALVGAGGGEGRDRRQGAGDDSAGDLAVLADSREKIGETPSTHSAGPGAIATDTSTRPRNHRREPADIAPLLRNWPTRALLWPGSISSRPIW